MRMKLLFAALCTALVLIAPSAAQAGFWLWPYSGPPFGYLGPGTTNYPYQLCNYPHEYGAVCSGNNYWAYVAANKTSGGLMHLGFTYSGGPLRGRYLSGYVYSLLTAQEIGWGGWYLRGQLTYYGAPESTVAGQAET